MCLACFKLGPHVLVDLCCRLLVLMAPAFSSPLGLLQRSSILDRVGIRSFHQPGMVNENVLESDLVPRCDGSTRRYSPADLRLLKGMKIRNSEWK